MFVLYGAVLSLTAKTCLALTGKQTSVSKDSTMHAPFDSTNSCFLLLFFPYKTNYTKVSKVLCFTSAVSTKISQLLV